jgi:hypothetical protein
MDSETADLVLTQGSGGCELVVDQIALAVTCGTISYGGTTIGTITAQGGGSYDVCVMSSSDSSDGGPSSAPVCVECQLEQGVVEVEDAGTQQASSPGTGFGAQEDAG